MENNDIGREDMLKGDVMDFQRMILLQREEKPAVNWKGTVLDYLKLVKENPIIASIATQRMYNAILKYGTNPVSNDRKIAGYDDLVTYDAFKDKIFGTEEPLHDLMKFLKAGAFRTETGKRILLLVGPPSGGKSSLVYHLKRILEQDDTPKYVVDGCPIHEEPLNMIPMEDRPYWEETLGVKIDGQPCPSCQHRLNNPANDKFPDGLLDPETGHSHWEKMPVVQFKFSEHLRKGIGVFQPSDKISQNESELIGRLNLSKAARHGDDDPRAYLFDGALEVANGGMLDFIELLKSDERLLYLLITVAQEKLIKSPGGAFPQIYIDSFLVGHTNLTEYEKFISRKENEALHDRIYVIKWPWNLRVNDEVNIYKKLIAESEFNNIHIAPYALEIAAKFAVITRLKPSTRCTSLVEKMKLYNDEVIADFKKEEVDIKGLRKEGRDNGEGLSGVSPRYIMNALNIALGSKEEKNCINPVDIIKSLNYCFEHHIGMSPEEKSKYIELLMEHVLEEYKTFAMKEVQLAFFSAYEVQAQSLFENYMRNASAYCRGEKLIDSTTGEHSDPDEKLMRSIEELAGVPIKSKREFRNGIFIHKVTALERGEEFTFRTFLVLKDAIEKKLLETLKNIVSLTLVDPIKALDDKTKARKNQVIENLMARGYCKSCAETLISFAAELMRRSE